MPSPSTLLELSGRACSIQCADALARVSEPWEAGVALCVGCGVTICQHQGDYCEACREASFRQRFGGVRRFRVFARR